MLSTGAFARTYGVEGAYSLEVPDTWIEAPKNVIDDQSKKSNQNFIFTFMVISESVINEDKGLICIVGSKKLTPEMAGQSLAEIAKNDEEILKNNPQMKTNSLTQELSSLNGREWASVTYIIDDAPGNPQITAIQYLTLKNDELYVVYFTLINDDLSLRGPEVKKIMESFQFLS